MVVVTIFVFGVVLVLGLSYLGTKLAYKLNEQEKPRMLTDRQKNDMARIKVLLERAEQDERAATYNLLEYHSDTADVHKRNADIWRSEAQEIAKKSGIKLEE